MSRQIRKGATEGAVRADYENSGKLKRRHRSPTRRHRCAVAEENLMRRPKRPVPLRRHSGGAGDLHPLSAGEVQSKAPQPGSYTMADREVDQRGERVVEEDAQPFGVHDEDVLRPAA